MPLRFSLFLYDLLRFAAIVGAVVQFGPGSNGESLGSSILPWLAFASPNVFFVLISLFLWVDPERHVSYVPLYTAGKLVFACAALLWLIFSVEDVLGGMSLGASGAAGSIALSVLFIPADLVSIVAARVLRGRPGSSGDAQSDAASIQEPVQGTGQGTGPGLEPGPQPGPDDLAETVEP
jgi:hypothetical protein